MWGLILLLVLISFAPRGFSLVLQFSLHLKNQHFQISTRSVMRWHFLTSSPELVSASWITLIPSLLILQATDSGEKSHHRKWRNLLCCTRYKTESWFFQTEVRGSWCKVLMFSKSVNFHFLWNESCTCQTMYTAVQLNSLLNYKLVCATKQGIGRGSSLSGIYCLQGWYRVLNSWKSLEVCPAIFQNWKKSLN